MEKAEMIHAARAAAAEVELRLGAHESCLLCCSAR